MTERVQRRAWADRSPGQSAPSSRPSPAMTNDCRQITIPLTRVGDSAGRKRRASHHRRIAARIATLSARAAAAGTGSTPIGARARSAAAQCVHGCLGAGGGAACGPASAAVSRAGYLNRRRGGQRKRRITRRARDDDGASWPPPATVKYGVCCGATRGECGAALGAAGDD